jgi:hypothetical protein
MVAAPSTIDTIATTAMDLPKIGQSAFDLFVPKQVASTVGTATTATVAARARAIAITPVASKKRRWTYRESSTGTGAAGTARHTRLRGLRRTWPENSFAVPCVEPAHHAYIMFRDRGVDRLKLESLSCPAKGSVEHLICLILPAKVPRRLGNDQPSKHESKCFKTMPSLIQRTFVFEDCKFVNQPNAKRNHCANDRQRREHGFARLQFKDMRSSLGVRRERRWGLSPNKVPPSIADSKPNVGIWICDSKQIGSGQHSCAATHTNNNISWAATHIIAP